MVANALPLLDTNVLLRHIVGDEPVQSPRATAYLARIERGELRARLSDAMIFETVYTLQRFYRVPRQEIRDALLPLLSLPSIVLPNKQRLHIAFDLYITYSLSFGDSYHASLVLSAGGDSIVSFDRGFDRVPGLTRIEP